MSYSAVMPYQGIGAFGDDVSDAIAAGVTQAQQDAISAGNNFPWNTVSPTTLAIQKQLNVWLKANKYTPIGEDGKLGPGTCGAMRVVPGFKPVSTCKSFTAPTKVGAGGGGGGYVSPTPAPATAPPMQYTGAGMSAGTKSFLIGGGIAALAVVGLVVAKKKGWLKK